MVPLALTHSHIPEAVTEMHLKVVKGKPLYAATSAYLSCLRTFLQLLPRSDWRRSARPALGLAARGVACVQPMGVVVFRLDRPREIVWFSLWFPFATSNK